MIHHDQTRSFLPLARFFWDYEKMHSVVTQLFFCPHGHYKKEEYEEEKMLICFERL